ncbi:MAG: hypothetical protein FWE19_09315 [Oscillospiraceae bacterium]|nr:hypothetical protein [Oscillospiraceae bacterium]
MRLWNVFKMELFKNWQDRTSLIIMLAFMAVNIMGGFMLSSGGWSASAIFPFSFSVLASLAFLFVYPYQMARIDYKNKVMSLLIASGVSRVQYYFVKVGATLIFSLLSFMLIAILPLFIVMLAEEGMSFAVEFFNFVFEIDAVTFGIIIFTWLSAFSILMTSVIISRGRGFTIFVFLGLYFLTSQIALFFHGGRSVWWNPDYAAIIVQHIITIIVMGLIGILILRKQDL